MKLTWKSELEGSIVAENPDETMSQYFGAKIRDAWLNEAGSFMEEVKVAVRTCKPGETVKIQSRPIKVTITKSADEKAVAEVGHLHSERKTNMDRDPVVLEATEASSCPWCGQQPTIQPWHGGKPTKKMVSCDNDYCAVGPSVTGETRRQALSFWDSRK